mmetsp:Transcript_57002/g.101169  ORF Transcript_57002/g.101169 Transcript_57002/m.101169 type:complete len:212 (-) Transcript_57002:149-784(-)
MSTKVDDVMLRIVTQATKKVRASSKVVRRIMREDKQVLCLRLGRALLEQLEGVVSSLLEVSVAHLFTFRVLAIRELLIVGCPRPVPALHVLVQVQGDHLEIELGMLLEPIVARHVEIVKVVRIIVDLSTRIWLLGACTWIVMVVVVSIDSVPWNAAKLLAVDISPFIVPLRIRFAAHSARVERISHVDDEVNITELFHLLGHDFPNRILAV